jgi:hypothetical protein
MFGVISRVRGSMLTGPRGLSRDMPLMASTGWAPSAEAPAASIPLRISVMPP